MDPLDHTVLWIHAQERGWVIGQLDLQLSKGPAHCFPGGRARPRLSSSVGGLSVLSAQGLTIQ